MRVEAGGRALAVYNIDGRLFATDDTCTHRRARLSDGYLDGRTVQCPLHFGRLIVPTGRPLNPPCVVPLATHPVAIDEGRLVVDLPD